MDYSRSEYIHLRQVGGVARSSPQQTARLATQRTDKDRITFRYLTDGHALSTITLIKHPKYIASTARRKNTFQSSRPSPSVFLHSYAMAAL